MFRSLLSNKSITLYAETCQGYIDIIQRLLKKNKEAKVCTLLHGWSFFNFAFVSARAANE